MVTKPLEDTMAALRRVAARVRDARIVWRKRQRRADADGSGGRVFGLLVSTDRNGR